jgi:hypothetical protein
VCFRSIGEFLGVLADLLTRSNFEKIEQVKMKYKPTGSQRQPKFIPDTFLKLLLHKENMGHVQLPDFALRAEFRGVPEKLLNHAVVLEVPVDAGLAHQGRNVLA